MRQGGDSQLASTSSSYTEDGFLKPEPPKEMTQQEFLEQEEIYRLRKVALTITFAVTIESVMTSCPIGALEKGRK